MEMSPQLLASPLEILSVYNPHSAKRVGYGLHINVNDGN